MAAPRKRVDWEAVERDFRAGTLSIREIAKIHDISDKAVRNKAKEFGWERDLSEKIAEKVRAELVRSESAPADPMTEKQIIDESAATRVHVVRSHRKRIGAQTELVDLLTRQLIDVAGKREDFEEAIEDETVADKTGERRAKLMKAVSLPMHASTAVNLANALKTLVGLERQAFSIKDETEPTTNALTDLLRQVNGAALPLGKAQLADDEE